MKNYGAKDFLIQRFAILRERTPIASVTQPEPAHVGVSSLDLAATGHNPVAVLLGGEDG